MRPCLTLLPAVAALLFIPPAFAENPLLARERIPVLIAALGDEEYAVREAADQLLDQLGADALPALLLARHHADPEVRRHADELVQRLERRLETARQLTTPRLRLQYKATPLAEVLADLTKRSGNAIKSDAVAEVLAQRTITLDGEWTFWEALQRVCEAGGLHEPEPDTVTQPKQPYLEEGNFRARGRRMLFLDQSRYGQAPSEREPITLLDGPPLPRATSRTGTLRVRLLGSQVSYPADSGGDKKHVPLTLEIKMEPRITWERLAAVRIDRVLDEQGENLSPPATVLGENKLQDVGDDVIIVWNGHSDFPLASVPQHFALQFPVTDRTGKRLREVRGTVAGWIRTAPEPLIKLDDLAKNLNVSFPGPDGSRLKVVDCKKEEDGLFKVQIELTPTRSPTLVEFLSQRIVRMNRRFADKVTTSLDSAESHPFAITDEKGEALGFVNGTCDQDSNGPSRVYTLIYKPDANDKGPARLVYRDRRCTFVEMPFVLKDVPLYKSEEKP